MTDQMVGPSDEELNTLWNCCGIADDYGHHEGNIFEYARAVIAHYGATPPRPVPVAERLPGPSDEPVEAAAQVIYESMRFERINSTPQWEPHGNSHAQDEARRCARAVLSRYGSTPPRPVPVAERPWDREGWCDARGLCWWSLGTTERWTLCRPHGRTVGWMLPAHAIPTPQENIDV